MSKLALGLLWPQYISIPLKTHISNPKLVHWHNVTRVMTLLLVGLSTVLFVDFKQTADVSMDFNAWMDASATYDPNHTPKYCNNSQYDFVYDKNWKYESMGCTRIGSSAFTKNVIAPGTFVIHTLLDSTISEICDYTTNTNSQGASCKGSPLFPLRNTKNFVAGVEEDLLTVQIVAKCPLKNYDSTAVKPAGTKPTKIRIHSPNGKVVEPLEKQRIGSSLGLVMSVGD